MVKSSSKSMLTPGGEAPSRGPRHGAIGAGSEGRKMKKRFEGDDERSTLIFTKTGLTRKVLFAGYGGTGRRLLGAGNMNKKPRYKEQDHRGGGETAEYGVSEDPQGEIGPFR